MNCCLTFLHDKYFEGHALLATFLDSLAHPLLACPGMFFWTLERSNSSYFPSVLVSFFPYRTVNFEDTCNQSIYVCKYRYVCAQKYAYVNYTGVHTHTHTHPPVHIYTLTRIPSPLKQASHHCVIFYAYLLHTIVVLYMHIRNLCISAHQYHRLPYNSQMCVYLQFYYKI